MPRAVTLVDHRTAHTRTIANVTAAVVMADRETRPPSTRLEFATGSPEYDTYGDHHWFRHHTPVD